LFGPDHLHKLFYSLLTCAAFFLLVALFCLLSYFDATNWWCYLLCQFRVQYAAILVTGVFIFLLQRSWLISGVLGLILIANALTLAPTLIIKKSAPRRQQSMKLLQINLNYKNEQYSRVLNYVQKVDADVLVLEEFTPEWEKQFEVELIRAAYPYQITVPRTDTYGIALFSKFPLTNKRILHLADFEWPSIMTEIAFDEKPMQIVAAHFMGPMTRLGWEEQTSQIEALVSRRDLLHGSLVIVGDFNTTPWTQNFGSLKKQLHLIDSLSSTGLQSSWPSPEPIVVLKKFGLTFTPQLFGINWAVSLPLDHCLSSQDLIIYDRKVGPFVGSDHFPLLVSIARL
jgi:endonuclease/exonuclease/phosphatase (EEP) superfamily protein YafD